MASGGRKVNFGAAPAYRSQYQQPKRQKHLGRFLRPAVVLLLVGLLLWAVFFSPLLQISTVYVKGNQQTTTADLRKDTLEILSSTLFGRNSLFVNTNRVGEQLQSRNQQLSSIRVSKGIFNSLTVVVVEQQPALQWKSSSSVFVLSSQGEAYKEQGDLDPALPLIEDSTNLPVKIGQKIAPAGFITFTTKLDAQLKQLKLGVKTMSVPETTNELYVTTNKGYTIKFDTTRDVESQLDDYRAVMATKITPKEYIDLRIAGKVFYK